MPTRLGQYADKVIELGWLAAIVWVPLYFNVYSSRVFEPDKISTLRSLVLIMLVAWLVKLFEGGFRAYSGSEAPTRTGRLADAVGGAAERGLPSWLGFLRVPMVIPILVYALAYLVSSTFTVTPDASLFGSYQRLQGTYSQYSYMLLGVLVLANLRTRPQMERLINFMILTSVPVVLYALLQWLRLDPLPWAGDTSTRVASSMGNAIFVAAWVIMIVPFTLYRLITGIQATVTARQVVEEEWVEPERGRGRASMRLRPVEGPDYGWAVVANSLGVLLATLFLFILALKLTAGLPFPDARMWPTFPLAIATFYLGCHAIEWLGKRRDNPLQTSLFMPLIGGLLALAAFLALPFSWGIDQGQSATGEQVLLTRVGFDGGALLWVLFFVLLWGALSALTYTLSSAERMAGRESRITRTALNLGYGLLLALQLVCIYLTQSRGPWLGLAAGLVVFAVALWLVGRRRQVRWMSRIGGAVSAIVLALALFVGALNIPDSPLKSLDQLPLIGRGIDRLSTLTRTEDGTGKVRTLIWEGGTNLVLSDPLRAIIGWGPEAMYVAYNPYYPPELAQWELRNATPDRSHNVEFDQLITMGVLGLATYYFLVGAFFFFAIRLLKRAVGTLDQLLGITLIAAMTAHFVEIQTGIQIAATWSYFYLMIGAMVAFGYQINPYLRRSEETSASEIAAEYAPNGAARTRREPVAVPLSVSAASSQTAGAAIATGVGGNGKASLPAQGSSKRREQAAQPDSANPARGRIPAPPPPQARNRAQLVRDAQAARTGERQWVKNPALIALYAALTVAALLVAWTVNVATVRADTLYKQGLAYDGAKRWSDSIVLYSQAVEIQPNQDYYYLFLGRAWLEFSKLVEQESQAQGKANVRVYYQQSDRTRNIFPTHVSCNAPRNYATQEDVKAEKLCRLQESEYLLKYANSLSPLNTDHYANLGRLYLYWGDPSGLNDPSKFQLAIQSFEAATKRTPGNAQLWDELGVAYNRNGQFQQGIDALLHSQRNVDPKFARTPYIRGQLYQERANAVSAALLAGTPLPTGGETDYGKLALETGRAYSETIGIDPSTFLVEGFKNQINFLVEGSKPLTNTNTTLSRETLSNIVTDTIALAFTNQILAQEKNLADYMRQLGVYNGEQDQVPGETLAALWQDPAWAGDPDGGGKVWLDTNLAAQIHNNVLAYYGLGYIYAQQGRTALAQASYQRALVLEPNNTDMQTELKNLTPTP